jgi:hypothetical protein
MKPKKCMTKKEQIQVWQELLIQATLEGKFDRIKQYKAIIEKLKAQGK